MKLSVVIPAHNEAGALARTVTRLAGRLIAAGIDYELVVVNDHSIDETPARAKALAREDRRVRVVSNEGPRGFGMAVRAGLSHMTGEAVAIVMADGSDDPRDLIRCYRALQEGYDCVFGSRFIRGAKVLGYPWHKLILNRLANTFIRLLFGIPHNDITNAFKCYRRHVIEGIQPLLANHFNLTVEMPLKAIVRGYSYATIPIHWYQRKRGVSKLKVQEMGSRYLFIVLYVFLEKHLSRGDYHRRLDAGASEVPLPMKRR